MAQDLEASGRSGSMPPHGPLMSHFNWRGFPLITMINQLTFMNSNH
jgi:hypothetical protein